MQDPTRCRVIRRALAGFSQDFQDAFALIADELNSTVQDERQLRALKLMHETLGERITKCDARINDVEQRPPRHGEGKRFADLANPTQPPKLRAFLEQYDTSWDAARDGIHEILCAACGGVAS